MGADENTRMELKYCEGCGGLLLRPADSGVIYCPTCREWLERVARPRPREERRGRPRRPRPPAETPGERPAEDLKAVAEVSVESDCPSLVAPDSGATGWEGPEPTAGDLPGDRPADTRRCA